MTESSLRYLIGISGPPGAGKTTLVRGLSAAMHDTTVIHLDSYRPVPPFPVHDQPGVEAEAGPGALVIPQLHEDLATLRNGRAVTEPGSGVEVPPRKYILFDTRFGRAHHATGRTIDLLVHIDTPLDVALARNLLKGIATSMQASRNQLFEEQVRGLQDYLDQYLHTVRASTIAETTRVAADADLIVDGLLPIPRLIERVKQEILHRLP